MQEMITLLVARQEASPARLSQKAIQWRKPGAGMAAHVERIGEHDGVQRVLEGLTVDLGRHRTLRGKGLGRKHGTQQQVEALEHALAPIVELAAAPIRGAVMLPRDARRAFGSVATLKMVTEDGPSGTGR